MTANNKDANSTVNKKNIIKDLLEKGKKKYAYEIIELAKAISEGK